MKKDIKAIIAKNIIDIRKANNLTQAQLAEKINYSDKAVSKWERGEASIDIETLYQLSELFSVNIEYFFEEDAAEKIETYSTNKGFLMKKIGTMILIMIAIFFVAISVYVTCFIQEFPFKNAAWILYVWATAASTLAAWLFFRKNRFKICALVFASITIWAALASVYFTALVNGMNYWMIFLVGIPIQAAVLVYKLTRIKVK